MGPVSCIGGPGGEIQKNYGGDRFDILMKMTHLKWLRFWLWASLRLGIVRVTLRRGS